MDTTTPPSLRRLFLPQHILFDPLDNAVYSPHVISLIVLPRKPPSGLCTIAPFYSTGVRVLAVPVKTVGLPFVAQEAGGGGEAHRRAVVDAAFEGLDVGVDVLAVPLEIS